MWTHVYLFIPGKWGTCHYNLFSIVLNPVTIITTPLSFSQPSLPYCSCASCPSYYGPLYVTSYLCLLYLISLCDVCKSFLVQKLFPGRSFRVFLLLSPAHYIFLQAWQGRFVCILTSHQCVVCVLEHPLQFNNFSTCILVNDFLHFYE